MLPVVICRHYDVEWLNTHTCHCLDCGKQGHWTEQGFAIWIRGQQRRESRVPQRNHGRAKKVA